MHKKGTQKMKIIVLHGEDTEKSYERLVKFMESARSRNWEIITDQFPATPSLFGVERLIVYRDFKLLSQTDIKKFTKFDGTLVIYHQAVLSQAFLKSLPRDTKIEKFDLPKLLYVFLESISPGNEKKSVKILHDLTRNTVVELVFYMLCRHLRDLYWVLVDPSSMMIPSWRLGRLRTQAEKFGVDLLKQMINKLSEIDIEVKTGTSDLASSLDLFIIKNIQ
jgi:hypothetical protein